MEQDTSDRLYNIRYYDPSDPAFAHTRFRSPDFLELTFPDVISMKPVRLEHPRRTTYVNGAREGETGPIPIEEYH